MSASQEQEQEQEVVRHITEQLWVPEVREDGVYLIGADDRSVILKMCRPDRGSDLLIAGYVAGIQVRKLKELDELTEQEDAL